ncbi:hypothetical protein CEK25_012167 [Fusarium fujikuroi]|nr:hypothetical protein CEK25_012167 [Fusarium fujikuroi]
MRKRLPSQEAGSIAVHQLMRNAYYRPVAAICELFSKHDKSNTAPITAPKYKMPSTRKRISLFVGGCSHIAERRTR